MSEAVPFCLEGVLDLSGIPAERLLEEIDARCKAIRNAMRHAQRVAITASIMERMMDMDRDEMASFVADAEGSSWAMATRRALRAKEIRCPSEWECKVSVLALRQAYAALDLPVPPRKQA